MNNVELFGNRGKHKCYVEEQEIDRLNNIINKLDKLIEQYSKNDYYYKYNGKYLKSEIINDLKQYLKIEI